METELRKLLGCTCLRMRRATRRLTQIYDHALEPTGLTSNQAAILAYLYGATNSPSSGLSIGAIAEWLGMDPSTLNRNLKPLAARGLVRNVPDPRDGRVRIVRITESGERSLIKAVPYWHKAQAQLEKAVGSQTATTLNELLDNAAAKLRAAAL
jgi:DNA-binding MarR family transcriptional regulator